jgi:hypothetical protein
MPRPSRSLRRAGARVDRSGAAGARGLQSPLALEERKAAVHSALAFLLLHISQRVPPKQERM